MTATPAKSLRTFPQLIHAAVYVRVSTTEQLTPRFNSLDSQREAGEAYVKAQKHEGWELIPDAYQDAGFSGGSLDRPALQRLLTDVKAGKVQRVVLYKLDRFSRSLSDFVKLAEIFEQHGASIVSVTQQFDTSTSMGRLTLNMLLSFAQFEREMIAERTADKMAASRRKGKRVGGMLILGYDAGEGGKLAINESEARRVRTIFELYSQHESLLRVVQELNRRGWSTKSWKTKNGHIRQGKQFTKGALRRMLGNYTYAGKVAYRGQVYDGEHKAIIDMTTWDRVQEILKRNGRSCGTQAHNRYGAFLNGLLRCAACGQSMVHAPTKKNGRAYRYYRCRTGMQQGMEACSGGSVPAPELERLVVDHIKAIGRDPQVVIATLMEAKKQLEAKKPELREETETLKGDLARHRQEMNRLVTLVASGDQVADAVSEHTADLHEIIGRKEARQKEVRRELKTLADATVDQDDLRKALSLFDPVWDTLYPPERLRVLNLLIERIDYNAAAGRVGLTFRPTGIRTLAAEVSGPGEDAE